jgi:drug/metabolite transporter (DMT)-like permease
MYYSLQYLPLADCTVLTFLAPGITCWICAILIKEPFTRIEKIATVISFTGVILIARPTSFFHSSGDAPPASGDGDMVPGKNATTPVKTPSDASDYDNVTPEQRLQAVAIAMLGVCGTVVAFTTIRWIGKRAHPLISVNYFAAWCTIVSFVMQFILPGVGFLLPADAKEWGYLIFLGVCGFVMVCSTEQHLSHESGSLDCDTDCFHSNSSSPPASRTRSLLELRT